MEENPKKLGRPKSANPRQFYACRLPKETIAGIKSLAAAQKTSESNIISELIGFAAMRKLKVGPAPQLLQDDRVRPDAAGIKHHTTMKNLIRDVLGVTLMDGDPSSFEPKPSVSLRRTESNQVLRPSEKKGE